MKIISYNIHTGTDKDKNRTLRQMAKYLKIQNCDIICLQEVLYSQYRMLKFYLQMDGSFAENVSDKQYGICIFSKYKILARNHVFLTSKKEQRGFAHIKVKINDAKITYQNPLKKSSSKYQIVIKFAVITTMHCNIINFNFFLSSFIPDPPAKYQFLYSAIITTLIL